jgi:hypothetical protein
MKRFIDILAGVAYGFAIAAIFIGPVEPLLFIIIGTTLIGVNG